MQTANPAMGWSGLSHGQQLVVAAYVTMSVITFVVYGLDKLAARGGRRRLPEKTLQLLALLGGWPGALIGMAVFRHKRRKGSFVAIVWLIALAHVAVLAVLATRA